MLVKELMTTEKNIQKALDDGTDKELSRLIHQLHGACCYCGVPRLKKILAHLEETLSTLTQEQKKEHIKQLFNEMHLVAEAKENKQYR